MKETPQIFPDTRWTLIQRITENVDASTSDLEIWCQSYWQPINIYIRSKGYDKDQADDLTQSFFEKLLSRGVDSSLPSSLEGKFRAYLKRSIKHYLIDEWRKQQAKIRGSGAKAIELEENSVSIDSSPDKEFDKSWVITVISNATKMLKEDLESNGKADFFEILSPLLQSKHQGKENQDAAEKLGMEAESFRVLLYRTRQKFYQLIRSEIQQTVETHQDFEEEVSYLMSLWT